VSGVPSFRRALARDAPLAAVALGRALRAAGLPVTPERSATFARAAALVGDGDRSRLYWAARVSFVTSRAQVDDFDRVFAAVVDGMADPADAVRGDPGAPAVPRPRRPRDGAREAPGETAAGAGRPGGASPAGEGVAGEGRSVLVGLRAAGASELAGARLDELDDAELALVARLLRGLAAAPPPRRARRTRRSPHGGHLDVHATLRAARRTGGDPVRRLHRRRRLRPRPLVALLDVSGSMAPFARAYLLLLEGAALGARAETFVFATRLTRVTRPLREGRAGAALARASAAAPDWAGGTHIGEALRAFNDGFGRRGMARDAVVVVLSDGWERGDPALLGREMERLARLAYRVVWVNPRAAAPGFEPVTGGMAAALPHVDDLVSGHSVAALDAVVAAIGRTR
jgi:hypothetical protein